MQGWIHKNMRLMTLPNTRIILQPVFRRLNQTAKIRTTISFSNPFSSASSGDVTSDAVNTENYTLESLVEEVATEHDLSVAKSRRIVDTVFDTISEVRVLLCCDL